MNENNKSQNTLYDRLENETEESDCNIVITDLSKDIDFTFTKPLYFELFGEKCSALKSWKQLYVLVTRLLYNYNATAFLTLPDRIIIRKNLAENRYHTPVEIVPDFVIETNRSANNLMANVRLMMDAVDLEYCSLKIAFSRDHVNYSKNENGNVCDDSVAEEKSNNLEITGNFHVEDNEDDSNKSFGGITGFVLWLRNILSAFPQITFGSYTGQTQQKYADALREYRLLNDNRLPAKNELICRDQMIETPPHILITNYAMLEYLMVRPKENVFFQGSMAEHWRFIVLDEAHIYSGSTGIEVSMLLRRLRGCLNSHNVQYILTSATLGDDSQNKDVAEFASELCNCEFTEKDIVRAVRQSPDYDGLTISRDLVDYVELAAAIKEDDEEALSIELKRMGYTPSDDLHRDIYHFVLLDQNYWNIRQLLDQSPQSVYQLAEMMNCRESEVEDFVTVASYGIKDNAQLFDAKYHMFIRACDSAFVTIGKSKKLMLTRNRQIYDRGLEYAVFEIAVCTFCHAIYLTGIINENGYFVQKSMFFFKA